MCLLGDEGGRGKAGLRKEKEGEEKQKEKRSAEPLRYICCALPSSATRSAGACPLSASKPMEQPREALIGSGEEQEARTMLSSPLKKRAVRLGDWGGNITETRRPRRSGGDARGVRRSTDCQRAK